MPSSSNSHTNHPDPVILPDCLYLVLSTAGAWRPELRFVLLKACWITGREVKQSDDISTWLNQSLLVYQQLPGYRRFKEFLNKIIPGRDVNSIDRTGEIAMAIICCAGG